MICPVSHIKCIVGFLTDIIQSSMRSQKDTYLNIYYDKTPTEKGRQVYQNLNLRLLKLKNPYFNGGVGVSMSLL